MKLIGSERAQAHFGFGQMIKGALGRPFSLPEIKRTGRLAAELCIQCRNQRIHFFDRVVVGH
jgi:hypothetical protein